MTGHWGKRNNQTSQGLLNTGSELTLFLGDPKCHCDLSGGVEALEGQLFLFLFLVVVICLFCFVLAQIHFSGSSRSLSSPCGYFSSSGIHN